MLAVSFPFARPEELPAECVLPIKYWCAFFIDEPTCRKYIRVNIIRSVAIGLAGHKAETVGAGADREGDYAPLRHEKVTIY